MTFASVLGAMIFRGNAPSESEITTLPNGIWCGTATQGFPGTGIVLKWATSGTSPEGIIIGQANGRTFSKSRKYDGSWPDEWAEL